MLIQDVERYLELRKTLGYKIRNTQRNLRAFAQLATERGDSHITTATAALWADRAPSPYSRSNRMRYVVQLARFLGAEDDRHAVPSLAPYHYAYVRPLPYIYSKEEIGKIIAATARLQKCHPLRKAVYATMLGLIAATGMRISEAINLQFEDIDPRGILRIRSTKFGKGRLVPLHPSAFEALNHYLVRRQMVVTESRHVFISRSLRRLSPSIVNYTFLVLLKIAKIAPERRVRPRIHDLRHTFATRALQECLSDRNSIAKHFVALSTYLGHVDFRQTYWYLQATPDLMSEIIDQVEKFMGGAK